MFWWNGKFLNICVCIIGIETFAITDKVDNKFLFYFIEIDIQSSRRWYKTQQSIYNSLFVIIE